MWPLSEIEVVWCRIIPSPLLTSFNLHRGSFSQTKLDSCLPVAAGGGCKPTRTDAIQVDWDRRQTVHWTHLWYLCGFSFPSAGTRVLSGSLAESWQSEFHPRIPVPTGGGEEKITVDSGSAICHIVGLMQKLSSFRFGTYLPSPVLSLPPNIPW